MAEKGIEESWSVTFNGINAHLQRKVSEWLFFQLAELSEIDIPLKRIVHSSRFENGLPTEAATQEILRHIETNGEQIIEEKYSRLKDPEYRGTGLFYYCLGAMVSLLHWLLSDVANARKILEQSLTELKKIRPVLDRLMLVEVWNPYHKQLPPIIYRLPLLYAIWGEQKKALQLACGFQAIHMSGMQDGLNDNNYRNQLVSLSRLSKDYINFGTILSAIDENLINITFGDLQVMQTFIQAYESAEYVKNEHPDSLRKYSFFIRGETGVGKESLARFINQVLTGDSEKFKAINCKEYPDPVFLRGELFGWQKGAFTGADRDYEGIFERAKGGTVFLDEIHGLEGVSQGLLLRTLQEGEVKRLGDKETRKVKFHLVSAANLKKLVDEDSGLRREFFERIAQARLTVPPLRERLLDIIAISLDLLEKKLAKKYDGKLLLARYGKSDWTFDIFDKYSIMGEGLLLKSASDLKAEYYKAKFIQDKAEKFIEKGISVLVSHSWPGNVRELENVITDLHIKANGKPLTAKFAREYLRNRQEYEGQATEESKGVGYPFTGLTLEQVEKQHISETIKTTNTLKEAEIQLGVSRNTLRLKRDKYDLK